MARGKEKNESEQRFWSLRRKLAFGSSVLLVTGAVVFGRDYVDQGLDWLHADEYYASSWIDRDARSVAVWGKVVAEASQDNDIAVDAAVGGEEIRVNIFQEGITQNGVSEFSFTPVRGLPYAIMLTLSQGNPEFSGKNSTGGLFPLPIKDGEGQKVGPRLASELGYETHDPFDPEQNATLWMYYMNELAARSWLSTEDSLIYGPMTTSQGKEELVIKEVISDYLRSLGIDPKPLVPEIYSLVIAHSQADNPQFKDLVDRSSEIRGRLDDAQKLIDKKSGTYERFTLKPEGGK